MRVHFTGIADSNYLGANVGMQMRRVLLWIGIIVALFNVLGAFVETLYYGGVPNMPIFSAPPSEGPYFLNANGHLTEVSPNVFTVLLWQGRSAFLTSLLGALCIWLLGKKKANSR